MPRKGKGNRTLTGAQGQGAKAPVGVPYGEGERALESQRRMPVPSGPPPVPGGGQGGTTGGPSAGAPSGGPPDLGMALAAAQGMRPPESAMDAPTARPGEPLVTGMEPTSRPLPAVNEGLYNLRAIYQRAPNEDLRKLIEYIERGL